LTGDLPRNRQTPVCSTKSVVGKSNAIVRKRRFLPRFGMRILFAGVFVAALPGVWWNSVLQQHRAEQRAIETIRTLHRVVIEDEPVTVNSTLGGFVEFEVVWCGPRALRHWSKSLPQFERVVGVSFVMESVGPQTIAALCELKRLRSIFLQDVPRAKEVAAIIQKNFPTCEVGIHPAWEVSLPQRASHP
jgi:hypothetical protein